MEAAAVSISKAALNGLLSGAKSTIAEETALTQAVQRDMVFLGDELEEMRSILRDVVQERDYSKVPRSRVKQFRSLAYDVEDCLQEYSVHLEKPSGWRLARTVLQRHRIAAEMKGLRARVEDMNRRNLHYQLMHSDGSANTTEQSGQTNISAPRIFGIHKERKPKVDLTQLIDEGNQDLRVIAVWGTSGVLGQSVIINGAYDDMKISKKFELYAWIRIVHPFNPLEFLQCIMSQFYSTSCQHAWKTQEKANIVSQLQVLKKIEMMKQDDLVDAFCEHVNDKSYLIVLNDMSTLEEWHAIKEYFPDNKKGSRIIVSTEHGAVASLCTGQESIVSVLNQPSVDQSIFVSHKKASQNQTAENVKTARKSLSRLGSMACALEEEKFELINLISNHDDEQFMVISVWGMGGVGKTTLVKEVYQSQELNVLFEKRAYVTITRPFVLNIVLKSLAMQLCEEPSNRKNNIDVGLGRRKVAEIMLLAEKLGKLIERKRCLIVLDDLSSVVEWSMIIQCLPKMENASRIVITTREENIAKHCSKKQENIYKIDVLNPKDALDLFTKKVFEEAINLEEHHPALMEEAKTIMQRCNGHPLAIVTIAGFLARQPKTTMQWRKLSEHIRAELEMNPELGIIRAVLLKIYDGLPFHLKSCFLYLSIFPEDYNISRRRLVHRWNAEGYSSEVRGGRSKGETADGYFMELIEQSMVLPSKEPTSSRQGISSCKLHDLMHEISISKAMEENLVFRMEEGCALNTQGTVRHLAISSNWEGDQSEFERVDLSRIRSLTVFGKWKSFYISDKMKLLRVLDLESTSGLVDHHLAPIWKLIHLKYLSLRECDGIFHLSESLGNLKQLETLDVTGTRIMKLPQAITKLRKLQYIHAGRLDNLILSGFSYDKLVADIPKPIRNKLCVWTVTLIAFCISNCIFEIRKSAIDIEDKDAINRRDVCTFFCCAVLPILARHGGPLGVAVPRGFRKLKALRTLGMVNIAAGKAILQDIKRLSKLRKLAVTGINKKNCQEFCSTLDHLSSLESLSVHSEEGLRHCLVSLCTPPEKLQSLKLYGTLGKLPEWVADLHNLVKLKLEGTELTDHDDTIQVLGKLPNLAILRLLSESFKAELRECRWGAFPSLMLLETGWSSGIESVQFEEGTAPKLELLLDRGRIHFSGLLCLPRLKEVKIMISKYTQSLDEVKTQLRRHPNKPVLKFI